jgi:uncharacterized membrane protein
MQFSNMHYFPLAWPFFLALVILLAVVVTLIEFEVLTYAQRMGVKPRYVMLILILSLVGSRFNIPVAQLPDEHVVTQREVEQNGYLYVIPFEQQWKGTVIAVNVGGALIPVLLSVYLVFKNSLYLRSIVATAIVAYVVHLLSHPVAGIGISVPTLIPPLVAGGVAMMLSLRKAPPLAYIAGSLGTLIGADLLNLDKIQGLGAPVASIGGAGTFDGIFLTGIIAVLLPPGPR